MCYPIESHISKLTAQIYKLERTPHLLYTLLGCFYFKIMIYDDKTLGSLSLEQLKEHEIKLISELKKDTEYWLSTYSGNENWSYKVETDVNCLKQVRKFIARF